jgi:hypothetical protein
MFTRHSLHLTAAAFLFVATSACANHGPEPELPRLEELVRLASPDSGGTGSPPPTPTGPGVFQGVIAGEGESTPERSADALGPDLPNVRVTVYQIAARTSVGGLRLGQEVATTVSNSFGEFQLPEIPGGEYVVTFVPPDGSAYQGAYWVATAHPNEVPVFWRVVLPKTK